MTKPRIDTGSREEFTVASWERCATRGRLIILHLLFSIVSPKRGSFRTGRRRIRRQCQLALSRRAAEEGNRRADGTQVPLMVRRSARLWRYSRQHRAIPPGTGFYLDGHGREYHDVAMSRCDVDARRAINVAVAASLRQNYAGAAPRLRVMICESRRWMQVVATTPRTEDWHRATSLRLVRRGQCLPDGATAEDFPVGRRPQDGWS